MRPIKFRGIRDNTNKWVYGSLLRTFKSNPIPGEETSWINDGDRSYKVVPESVGQFTGLVDKNGNDIYEDDILNDEFGRLLLVEWYGCGYTFKAIRTTNFMRAHIIMEWFEEDEPRPEIIGNSHQNKEMIEGVI